MTTLETIGFTLAGGLVVSVFSLLWFGLAVRSRCIYVAPRCTARPHDVIYNPKPSNPCQDRGSAILGWIKWTLGLTYPTMLEGIPGTGTRKGGMEGLKLTVNLDGIVLLRFHAACLRVAVLATFLCLFVVLPINVTTRCVNQDELDLCSTNGYNLTNYERTTLANIPSLNLDPTLDASGQTVYQAEPLSTNRIWGKDIGGLLARLYAIVFCAWAIYLYACHTMKREWDDILAMRRVYFLEADIWEQRKLELSNTIFSEQPEGSGVVSDRETQKKKPRDVWIPNAEMRETVPNVSLYSVLVGGLPSLPAQVVDEDDVEMAVSFSKRQSIDWQLGVATAFFDQCVPNQPGFSSSVAAVTILPDAQAIANAWKKWYAHAGALRRLRFIRGLISELRYYDIDDDEDEVYENGIEVEENGIKPERGFEQENSATKELYRDLSNSEYYKELLSSFHDEEVEDLFLIHLEFGPEQTAIYSRELAQSAAQCCPNGCGEKRLRRARIDELLVVEHDAIVRVEETYRDLQEARDKVAKRQGQSNNQVQDLLNQPNPESRLGALPEDLRAEKQALEKFNMNANNIDINATRRRSGKVAHSVEGMSNDAFPDLSATGARSYDSGNDSNRWSRVERIINEGGWEGLRKIRGRHASLGEWKLPSFEEIRKRTNKGIDKVGKWACTKTNKAVDDLARESTYAVVTFTSRQAAVAARNCLTDGRGQDRWLGERNIPVPPLADSGACDFLTCRGCCRPVTLSIPNKQKLVRKLSAAVLLAGIYIFYTIPLTFASNLANPANLEQLFPDLKNWDLQDHNVYNLLSGMIVALIWTFFFSLCPVMFKSISNSGSAATSVLAAEYRALQYFWWFMLITAFSGNLLSTMVINGFNVARQGGITIGSEVQRVLVEIALTIPTQIAASWINWIIVKFTITLPLNYMLQINTFLFSCLGWNCCKRLVMGGGPGAVVPYRIYVDSGVVFLCIVALAPASPIVAPCALAYYLYCQPLFRRNLIFVYRPKFDAGGTRWPFLFDMVISSLVLGQVLLTTMMALKQAVGPAIVAALPVVPTLVFQYTTKRRYLRAFQDGALLQTSNLDMWDNSLPTSIEKREEFRRFLVDAHKASYVPVCIAGRDDGRRTLTAEPAVVVRHPHDIPNSHDESPAVQEDDSISIGLSDSNLELQAFLQGSGTNFNNSSTSNQYGASLRRLNGIMPTSGSIAHGHLSFNEDGSVSTSLPRRRTSSHFSRGSLRPLSSPP